MLRKREPRFSRQQRFDWPVLKGFHKPQSDSGTRAKRRRRKSKS